MTWIYIAIAAGTVAWVACTYFGYRQSGLRFSSWDVVGGFFMAILVMVGLLAFAAWVAILVNA